MNSAFIGTDVAVKNQNHKCKKVTVKTVTFFVN